MIDTTFEQIEYGFVLLEINKKHLDINRFRKYKIERFGLNRPLQCLWDSGEFTQMDLFSDILLTTIIFVRF